MRDINQYADWTVSRWFTTGDPTDKDLTVMSLGLAGECGEVMEILKKRIRDGQFDLNHLKSELGDVIYYWARLVKAFGLDPSEVLSLNVEKIEKRQAENRPKLTRDQLVALISSMIGEQADEVIEIVMSSGVKK